MSEGVWIAVFIVFIIIIVVLFYVFSGNTAVNPVVNNGGVVANNGVVLQPGVGYVAATNTCATGTWSSGMIIVAMIVFIIIIALIIWAVYPRRPVVVPPPPLPPMPQPVTVSVPPPAASQEYHYFHEVPAPPPPPVVVQSPPPPVIVQQPPPVVAAPRPVIVPAPGLGAAAPPVAGRTSVAAGVNQYGQPVTYSRTSTGGGATFDPDPVTTQTVVPGVDYHGVVQHSDLGLVQGQYHRDPRIVTQTTDVGRHQVIPARGGSYIGPGAARYAAPLVRYA